MVAFWTHLWLFGFVLQGVSLLGFGTLLVVVLLFAMFLLFMHSLLKGAAVVPHFVVQSLLSLRKQVVVMFLLVLRYWTHLLLQPMLFLVVIFLAKGLRVHGFGNLLLLVVTLSLFMFYLLKFEAMLRHVTVVVFPFMVNMQKGMVKLAFGILLVLVFTKFLAVLVLRGPLRRYWTHLLFVLMLMLLLCVDMNLLMFLKLSILSGVMLLASRL